MIQLATLNTLTNPTTLPLQHLARSAVSKAPIDILCCMGSTEQQADQYRQVADMADELAMSYMFTTVKNEEEKWQPGTKGSSTNLITFTGKNSWVLNSGSLSFFAREEKLRQAQFAVIRIKGNSIIVLNAQFQGGEKGAKSQLNSLLSPATLFKKGEITCNRTVCKILSGQFGAFILNSNINTVLRRKEINRIAADHGMIAHEFDQQEKMDPSLIILSHGYNSNTSIRLENATPLPHGSGLITTLDIKRLHREDKIKSYLPLSFRERWLGGDGRVFVS